MERLRYPWLDKVPALNRSFTLREYLDEATPAGIVSMLHMEVDVAEVDMEAETALVSAIGDPVIGAIAACRPENTDFKPVFERLAANPKVRGFRRVLHTGAFEYADSDLFIGNIRSLARTGHPFDLCVWPRHIPLAYSIAKACPDVQFVLDHCGMPDIKGGDFDVWARDTARLAELPNVACKISGVIAYADGKRQLVDQLRPYVEYSILNFGWERVVWGSDWPVCNNIASLSHWVKITQDLLDGTSEIEKKKLFSENARRIYGLPLRKSHADPAHRS